jgi:hypothetical protein
MDGGVYDINEWDDWKDEKISNISDKNNVVKYSIVIGKK